MFESYYELNANPFRLSADESFRFAHKNYLKAWSYLSYALEQGEGFVMITGQPGSGKTTLIRDILSKLDESKILAINLVTNQLQAEELLRKVALEYGLPAETYNKATLLTRIEEFVEKQYQAGRRAIIVIDEAQNLTLNGLEELRLLSNLQTGSHPLFQIFLVGQDELRSVVLSPEMEQVRQRLIASCQIEPMTVQQSEDYIEHRLGIVGWHGDPEFDSATFPLIHYLTNGIPRKINHVVSRLMLYGALEEKHEFTEDDVWIVAEELFDEERLSIKSGQTFESFKSGYADVESRQEDREEDEGPRQDDPSAPSVSTVTHDVENDGIIGDIPGEEVTNDAPPDELIDEAVDDVSQRVCPGEVETYQEEDTAALFPESKTFLTEDEVALLTSKIVTENHSAADELVVETSDDTRKRDESVEDDDQTLRNWPRSPETSQQAPREAEEILNLPTMQAEKRKHEIDAKGGLINTDETLDTNELFAGGIGRSLRNIVLFVAAGLLILVIFIVRPEQVGSLWSELNARIHTLFKPQDAELTVTDNDFFPESDRSSSENADANTVDVQQEINTTDLQVEQTQTNTVIEDKVRQDLAAAEGAQGLESSPETNQTVPEQLEIIPDAKETGDVKEASKDYIATQSRYQQVVIDEPSLTEEGAGDERKFQVFFEFNNTDIPEQFNDMLNDLFIVLSLNEQASLKISGYTDASGDPLYNMRLSLERAQTVSRYFTERGIAQARIQVEGHGPIPKSSNKAREALEKRFGNRRVELVLRDGLE